MPRRLTILAGHCVTAPSNARLPKDMKIEGAKLARILLEEFFVSSEFAKERGFDVVRRVILIVVNARSDHARDWQKDESPPGSLNQLAQATGVPIERYSFETVELIKDRAAVADWRRRLFIAEAQLAGMSLEAAEVKFPQIDAHVIDVNFETLADPEERAFFMNLPTSFVLEDDEVDRLREVGGRLLRASPVYQELLQKMAAGGTTPTRR
jgi:NTE family protein